ncbi:HD-GYP domain-containing protein [Methylophilus sp. 5]|uniref:HD-GYP domain-containing protein n=1 Tax=Methylophilus sp. 5 TaxID=1112274 RepID=UPI000490A5F6|nr:HD domain-containing phosphohydrolase [Methylophilus sp. 5]
MRPQYKIVLVYVLVGAAWIFFSDKLVASLFTDAHDLTLVQDIKGWLFILVTAILLFILVKRALENAAHQQQKLIDSYDQTIRGWVQVLDLRHKETKDHTYRVAAMTVALASKMGVTDAMSLKRIERSAILHDIGKIGIPDAVLIKPGQLDDDEMRLMRTHPQIARDLLANIDFLSNCMDIPYGHHERWDGHGYPLGLTGEEIPFAARIFSIVDVWDALIHPRVYKQAWPEDKVRDYIRNESGIRFDPAAVEVFFAHYEVIKAAAASLPTS